MDLDSYSIQQLEAIDFRSALGKKLKSEMGISTKDIKKKINDIILKKKESMMKTESKDFLDMIELLPNKTINIRECNSKKFVKSESDKKKDNIENIDFTIDDDIEYVDNIDFTLDDNEEKVSEENLNNSQDNIKTLDTETNSVNYIVQLFNSDETVQLKLTRDEFINFAINNGYSQEFILQFLNQGNKTNICKIDEYQWLNDDFLSKLRNIIRETPLFFDSELSLLKDEEKDDLYDKIYQIILDDIEENKRRSVEEMKDMNNEQLETLKNQYNTINTIEERLQNRFVDYKDRDILKECDLFREDKFFEMINELEKISDSRIRVFLIHHRYNCVHNKQRDVIDKIVRVLIPPPKGFK